MEGRTVPSPSHSTILARWLPLTYSSEYFPEINQWFTKNRFNILLQVFNISIRLRPDGQVALGKEKVEEVAYSSVVAMVDHHRVGPPHPDPDHPRQSP